MSLTKEQIFNADDLKVITVDIPEWGDTVNIRSMKAKDRAECEAWGINHPGNMAGLKERMVMKSVLNGDDSLMFTTEEDFRHLGEKNSKAIDRIFGALLKLNGIGDDEAKEMVENLGGGPS